jgi:hypothetical protein
MSMRYRTGCHVPNQYQHRVPLSPDGVVVHHIISFAIDYKQSSSALSDVVRAGSIDTKLSLNTSLFVCTSEAFAS